MYTATVPKAGLKNQNRATRQRSSSKSQSRNNPKRIIHMEPSGTNIDRLLLDQAQRNKKLMGVLNNSVEADARNVLPSAEASIQNYVAELETEVRRLREIVQTERSKYETFRAALRETAARALELEEKYIDITENDWEKWIQ